MPHQLVKRVSWSKGVQVPKPKSQILNPKSQLPNPESQCPNSESHILNPKIFGMVWYGLVRFGMEKNQIGHSGGGQVIFLCLDCLQNLNHKIWLRLN